MILTTLLFTPDIWGTVSDWTMVIVTSATAILLLMTLKPQRDVQRTQYELFRIENIRFKESIKPILKYSGCQNQFKSNNGKENIFTIEVINETTSAALKISRFVSTDEQTKQLFCGAIGFDSKRDHLIKGDKPLLFHFGIDSDLTTFHYIIFIVKYQDIAETNYQQRVFCVYDENYGLEIHPGLPEIIS